MGQGKGAPVWAANVVGWGLYGPTTLCVLTMPTNPSPPNLKPCRFGGSGFAELEFWFWAFWVPGRMGAAGLKLQLSTYAVWLW